MIGFPNLCRLTPFEQCTQVEGLFSCSRHTQQFTATQYSKQYIYGYDEFWHITFAKSTLSHTNTTDLHWALTAPMELHAFRTRFHIQTQNTVWIFNWHAVIMHMILMTCCSAYAIFLRFNCWKEKPAQTLTPECVQENDKSEFPENKKIKAKKTVHEKSINDFVFFIFIFAVSALHCSWT